MFCGKQITGSKNDSDPCQLSLGQEAWLILTVRASNSTVLRAHSASKEDCQASRLLPACTPHRPAWFGHAPGIEQFSEPFFREDFLLFGHLAHGLA